MALAGEFKDDGVVDEAIDDGVGGGIVGKDLGPVGKREIGCDADAAAFVAVRYDLKEQVGGFALERNVAEFFDDYKRVSVDRGEPLFETIFAFCRDE